MPHYFDEDPAAPSAPVDVLWALPDGPLRVRTDRGVFGHGRPDPGTKLLLLSVPAPPQEGDLLDLGCGAGVIALAMARRAPGATVWAVDVNRRARELCAANARANGIGNVVVAAPEELPHDVALRAIWSNPPIRIGKPALHELLRHWLGRLADGAEAHLVVHRHLGADSLARWLAAERHTVARVALGAGYRVLRVGPPSAGPAAAV